MWTAYNMMSHTCDTEWDGTPCHAMRYSSHTLQYIQLAPMQYSMMRCDTVAHPACSAVRCCPLSPTISHAYGGEAGHRAVACITQMYDKLMMMAAVAYSYACMHAGGWVGGWVGVLRRWPWPLLHVWQAQDKKPRAPASGAQSSSGLTWLSMSHMKQLAASVQPTTPRPEKEHGTSSGRIMMWFLYMFGFMPVVCSVQNSRVGGRNWAGNWAGSRCPIIMIKNKNNNRRLVTLAEHTSDHGRQTNSSTEEKGEQV